MISGQRRQVQLCEGWINQSRGIKSVIKYIEVIVLVAQKLLLEANRRVSQNNLTIVHTE